MTHRTCATRCRDERITLRRDGRAERSYWSGKRADSLYLATIDSSTFANLARRFIEGGFFLQRDEEGDVLTNASYVISAATQCRRHVASIGGITINRYAELRATFATVVGALEWRRCCQL